MFGIDHESLELIQDTAKKSVECKLIPLPNDPERHLLIGNGEHKIIDTEFVERPRRHTVATIKGFAEAYARWSLDGTEVVDGSHDSVDLVTRPPCVWVDMEARAVTFFCDEPLRRSWVKLNLTLSPQWLLLQKYREQQLLDQKAIVRLFRHDLQGCVDPGVVAAFRSIDFQKIANARGTIGHGKQSLDSDVVAQVTSGPLPEDILVRFPPFAMNELIVECPVTLTVDIDAANQRFTLQALPGDLEAALEEARNALIDRIAGELAAADHEGVTILAGSPSTGRRSDDE
jgi:hypothetical protein